GGGADAEGEDEDGDGGECGLGPQGAGGVAKILQEAFEPHPSPDFASFLGGTCQVADSARVAVLASECGEGFQLFMHIALAIGATFPPLTRPTDSRLRALLLRAHGFAVPMTRATALTKSAQRDCCSMSCLRPSGVSL